MQNYFNYFTEIEEHFQRRRGGVLLLSTLDWALIEIWRDAGIPLEVVLRGMDQAFDRHEARQRATSRRLRQVNGLAWCSQAVMEAAEQQREAAMGSFAAGDGGKAGSEAGFEAVRVAEHLESCAQGLDSASIAHEAMHESWTSALAALALSLRRLAAEVHNEDRPDLEALERHLATLEDRLFATLTSHVPEEVLLRFKTEAAKDLAAYRSRMGAVQLKQIEQQFVHKRLMEEYQLSRLSLFYMRQS